MKARAPINVSSDTFRLFSMPFADREREKEREKEKEKKKRKSKKKRKTPTEETITTR